MPERAGARLWVSIVAAVIIFPGAVILLLAAWVIHVQIGLPTLTDPGPVTLAPAPAISPVQEKLEAAMPPQRARATEPIALPPQAPEPSSTMPTPGEASPADADRAQGALPSAVRMMAGKPAAPEPPGPIAGPVAPMPAQVAATVRPPPATAVEPVAPTPDAKVPEFASASSLFATLADFGQGVPRLRRSHPRHVRFSSPDDDGQARHTRTRRADLGAGPAAQAKAPCHRRPRRSRGAIAAAPARADTVTVHLRGAISKGIGE